jgi:hypothetical protein
VIIVRPTAALKKPHVTRRVSRETPMKNLVMTLSIKGLAIVTNMQIIFAIIIFVISIGDFMSSWFGFKAVIPVPNNAAPHTKA